MVIPPFPLPRNLEEGRLWQENLRRKVILKPFPIENLRTIGGVDVTYKEGKGNACIVVFSFPSLEVKEVVYGEKEVDFPYVPGYLAYREIPPILEALKRLSLLPQILVLDAHGIAHPLRFGLASHLGVHINHPTIGCAKRKFIGSYEIKEGESWGYLVENGEILGIAVLPEKGKKPFFVSPGHLVDVETSFEIIIRTLKGYSLPEVTRIPHLYLKRVLL
ncbi:MAG TPA: endonuclease V [bacterium]|nr:endonuclease V [bacterium]HEX67550.1 endonuclease V [bacterium]